VSDPLLHRRSFLKGSAALAAGAGLPGWFVERLRAEPPASPNDRPNVGLIGCGGQGVGIAKAAAKRCNLVAVCDVDAKHAEAGAKAFPGARVYKDFRRLLERDDVHAVLNATPDHWHTLVNLAAVRAGKDVYSEKPLTLTIDEGKRLVAAVREAKRVLQTGSQQRSDARFRLACELVRNGRLGKLTHVTTILPAGLHTGPFASKPVPPELEVIRLLGGGPGREGAARRGGRVGADRGQGFRAGGVALPAQPDQRAEQRRVHLVGGRGVTLGHGEDGVEKPVARPQRLQPGHAAAAAGQVPFQALGLGVRQLPDEEPLQVLDGRAWNGAGHESFPVPLSNSESV
jgi:hypothetical protein